MVTVQIKAKKWRFRVVCKEMLAKFVYSCFQYNEEEVKTKAGR